jgi:hypothetical protein
MKLLLLALISAQAIALVCSECQKTGQKSKVYSNGSCQSTLLACADPSYYDENGKFVYVPHKDCNTTTCSYRCDKGHEFQEVFEPANVNMNDLAGAVSAEKP